MMCNCSCQTPFFDQFVVSNAWGLLISRYFPHFQLWICGCFGILCVTRLFLRELLNHGYLMPETAFFPPIPPVTVHGGAATTTATTANTDSTPVLRRR